MIPACCSPVPHLTQVLLSISSVAPVDTYPLLAEALDEVSINPHPPTTTPHAVCVTCGSYIPQWIPRPTPCP